MISVLLAATILAGVQPEQPPREFSSADDCEIFALLARERLNFGHQRSLEGARIGDYQIRCDWAAYGLDDPSVTDHATTERVTFTRPGYGWRRKGASVGYTIHHYNHHWDVHRVTGSEDFGCALKRGPQGWKIVQCQPGLPQ